MTMYEVGCVCVLEDGYPTRARRDPTGQAGFGQIFRNYVIKLSSGEFKTILNEGKSTVWRYFCLVVDADSN